MSASIDLDDLEGARDELRDSVMQILRVVTEHPETRDELVRAVLWLGGVHTTIERALYEHGEPVKKGANDG